jgi:hypothetical protein
VIQKKKPAKRAFPWMAGSPFAKRTRPAKSKPEEPEPVEVLDGRTGIVIPAPDPVPKRGRPRVNPDKPMTPVERKRLERANKAAKLAEQQRQQMVAETVREQRIDQKTGSRGAGMNMPEAPHGRGRVETGGYSSTKIDVVDGHHEQMVDGGIVREGTGTRLNDHTFESRERHWLKDRELQSRIETRHYCKYCQKKPRPAFSVFKGENGAIGAFDHVLEKHPEKSLPELGIVSIFSCRQCKKKFKFLADALRHVASLRRKHKRIS